MPQKQESTLPEDLEKEQFFCLGVGFFFVFFVFDGTFVILLEKACINIYNFIQQLDNL